jgi:hypothetical protein
MRWIGPVLTGILCLTAGCARVNEPRTQLFLDLVNERNSAATWPRHIGNDCVWVGNGLRVATRAEVSGMQLDTGKRVEITEFKARDYGDVAVLTYLVTEHHPQEGGERVVRLRKMDTYMQQDGHWQLIANAEVVGRPDRTAVSIDAAALDRLAGSYETVFDGKPVRTKIWREGAHLFAQTEGQEKGELLPLSPTLFFDAAEPQEGGPENVFVIGDDGRATQWIYRSAGVEFPARRLPDAP